MINCNPETVSTDFDTADKLYFEPVFWEHIYDIILPRKTRRRHRAARRADGALKIAEKLEKYGIKIIGTSFAALDIAEDRERFSSCCATSASRIPSSVRSPPRKKASP
jgi:carbamoyl-phosphate synthase large subunit